MYDKQWYERYAEYLQEKTVRAAHDKVLKLFHTLLCDEYGKYVNVVDLGCGSQEYARHGNWSKYFGIDKNADKFPVFIEGNYSYEVTNHDYTKLRPLKNYVPFEPDVFVSLFSTELFISPYDKDKYYEQLFRDNLSIKYGLVSGIIYKGNEDCIEVDEEGQYVYQSIENQYHWRSDWFDEWRHYINVPSEMFGPDVVEVWKIFMRK